ncbi:MAG TPA: zinc ribbon domain-containing protein [Chloroflexi bacterium]|mgnify:CR=1 FL=1|nr:zinc ribbon domain-containing protein [Chloroflexota bacterium]
MPYCQHCGGKTGDDAIFCPKCGEILVGEDIGWNEFQIQEEIDGAKHRANMYTISAIVLATLGLVGGGILCALLSLLGLFGIPFVCLGGGCATWAARYERKARNLQKQLSR